MIWLLQMLILGHAHKWKEVDRVPVKMIDTGTTGQRVYTVCEKCGAHKKWDLA